jgi:hypothetical protein
MTVLLSTKVYSVPLKTLTDTLNGQITHGCRSAPPTLLAPEDENSLVQYYIYCASHGVSFHQTTANDTSNKISR